MSVAHIRPWRGDACRAFLSLLMIGAAGITASAQAPVDPAERPRLQVGPLGLSPSIALTNAGIDTNVFNEFENRRRDVTFTVSPQLDLWLRAGRARLQVAARGDLVYYQKYSSERSRGGAFDSRLEMQTARVIPWLTGSVAAGRQRYGYEIDSRFYRIARDVAAGVDTRVAGRTRVGISAGRVTYSHEAGALFLGSSLRDALDRRTDTLGLQVQYALTPLTTLVVSGGRSYDRFEFTPTRDADSSRVDAGFDLAPSALIAGRGRVGYRRLTGTGGALPPYSGVVVSVGAASTLKGRTRIEVMSERDVNYSWELMYPYFVLTGATVTVTPQLTRRWDVQGRVGVQRLAYRPATDVPGLLTDRVDRFVLMGAGIGNRLGRDMRVGINVDRERRESPVWRRAYEGYRTGISVTYGR
jgi:hypothetical protein